MSQNKYHSWELIIPNYNTGSSLLPSPEFSIWLFVESVCALCLYCSLLYASLQSHHIYATHTRDFSRVTYEPVLFSFSYATSIGVFHNVLDVLISVSVGPHLCANPDLLELISNSEAKTIFHKQCTRVTTDRNAQSTDWRMNRRKSPENADSHFWLLTIMIYSPCLDKKMWLWNRFYGHACTSIF